MDNKMLRLLLLDSNGVLKMAALASLLERIRALVGPDASMDVAASSLKIQGAPETASALVATTVSDDITYTSSLGETVTFHTVDDTYGAHTVKVFIDGPGYTDLEKRRDDREAVIREAYAEHG